MARSVSLVLVLLSVFISIVKGQPAAQGAADLSQLLQQAGGGKSENGEYSNLRFRFLIPRIILLSICQNCFWVKLFENPKQPSQMSSVISGVPEICNTF